MSEYKSIAIIPARGGSKRLRKKNLQKIGDLSLVGHALKAAVESECFDKVILSSDDLDIIKEGGGFKTVEQMHREFEFSTDTVTALDLVLHIVEKEELEKNYDIISLLLPTCPFRKSSHIKEAFDLLDRKIDGVVSLTEYEFPPQLSVTLDSGLVKPVFNPCPLITGNTRSQDQDTIFRPNGAFYIQWMDSFVLNKNFWKGKIKGFPMSRLDSVDVDNLTDLEYARFIEANER